MKKASSFLLSILMFLALGLTFNACVDKDFDEPSADGTDPNIEATSTVAQVKALHNGSSITDITDDVVIKGVVISNDKEGNFYKEMYIQDETGGIKVSLDFTNINADYKEGRNIFIKCKGLKINKFGELYSLGLGVTDNGRLGRIPENVKDDYIFPGKLNQNVVPKVISINDFAGAVGTLVTIEDIQFIASEAGTVNYADPSTTGGGRGENRTIEDCNGKKLTVRNSDYASFAETKLPAGKGKITGVASAFGSKNQLLIRSTEDVDMTGDRCDGSGGGGSGDLKTIAEVRALFSGSNTNAPADTKIKGIVISDKEGGNLHSKNLVIQDATAGIAVRFAENHSFALNDEVEINVSGVEISEYKGLLQLNKVPNANATKTGTGTVTPVEKTTSEIKANLESLESTLVKIKDATLSGGTTYGGSLTITDASSTIPMYTRSSAAFASTSVPSGTVQIVGIASQFNDAQINIRNANDVTGGSGGGGTGGNETLKTISEVRALFSGSNTNAPADTKIKGIVISDKEGGNLHSKNLVIQDATAGIAVRFAANHSFNLNDEVEIVVSGIEISEYNGLLQLNNVPVANATKTGTGSVTPVEKTASEIAANLESLESTLVKIKDATLSGGTTYGGSLTITDASGTVPMYTRSGAAFASTPVPSGTVQIVGIVSQFNDAQINIRNANDVTGGSGGGGTGETLKTISEIRALFTGSNTTAPANAKIKGIVTSDRAAKNIHSKNLVIQDATRGIVVRFQGNPTFDLNDEVEIIISGVEISEYKGLLQLNNVPLANATKTGTGTVTPVEKTASEIASNLENLESTLVKIVGATLSGGTTYGGSLTVTDASGTIPMYTRSGATFASTSVPSGTVTIIAIVSQFNDAQINIRNASDVQ